MSSMISKLNLQNNFSFGRISSKKQEEADIQKTANITGQGMMSKSASNALRAMALALALLPSTMLAQEGKEFVNSNEKEPVKTEQQIPESVMLDKITNLMEKISPDDKEKVMEGVQQITDILANQNLSQEQKISKISKKLSAIKSPLFVLGVAFATLGIATLAVTLLHEQKTQKYEPDIFSIGETFAFAGLITMAASAFTSNDIIPDYKNVATEIVQICEKEQANNPEFYSNMQNMLKQMSFDDAIKSIK